MPRSSQDSIFAPYVEIAGELTVVLVITYLSLVFGELVPKRLALCTIRSALTRR